MLHETYSGQELRVKLVEKLTTSGIADKLKVLSAHLVPTEIKTVC